MDIQSIYSLIEDDMTAVDNLIQQRLQSDVALINQLGFYIINSGGKRLRPAIAILSAKACGYEGDKHINLATIIEFIHTATLLHDDVVDNSAMRRGQETANNLWGNEASVLVGDFLYTRSFEMMVEMDSMRLMKILSSTTNIIAEGEVLQLLNCHDADTTEARYLEVIHHKTAKLFEAAGQLGAVISRSADDIEQAMARYAMHLGSAFQLVDDLLDYSQSSETIGKNIGDDLAEGKPTLPLIHAMRQGTDQQAAIIREAIEQGQRDRIDEIITIINETGAIDYTAHAAAQEVAYAKQALATLPETDYKQALLSLADFSISRDY
ncbi:Octaprenyl-diphosphate synthase/Dimethylallyltransferase/Geranyltranstransferase (farnesyldiphosphate synthase)/Geranylgeranyl pyrophosphate synthetase [Methylophaga thiooxydans]|uniref:Octaprenyl diphosphate synthase n=1 Tax=Methylophaga thiooxydans TaxID=392484 RepID=A0A0A0BHP4_9GAMM|nr:octaprenyl diphosphate synthase [Methylophaga thiooxydans]KGM08053.1 Octaprenyl-diphosphate synthase/Dimethylallyltransferase/Geranyltranstransferase (farnesyldiphosphate synthase)/Geranylgeranyl pyrophosphate synthetase [Methylophaga thiooxydans]